MTPLVTIVFGVKKARLHTCGSGDSPAAFDLDFAFARVERTLLSVAFEAGFDFDFDFDFLSPEPPRVPHPCAFCAQEPALSLPKGWEPQKPAALAFDVAVVFEAGFDFDFLSPEPPRVPHPCAFCAQEPALSLPKGWEPQKPADLAFDVAVVFDLA